MCRRSAVKRERFCIVCRAYMLSVMQSSGYLQPIDGDEPADPPVDLAAVLHESADEDSPCQSKRSR